MKLLNRQQFLALRGEYVYAKYKPSYTYDFGIKMCNTGSNDFCYMSLTDNIESVSSGDNMDKWFEAENRPGEISMPMNFEDGGRDGSYDGPDVMFAVWEDHDLDAFIQRLQDVRNKKNNYEEEQ